MEDWMGILIGLIVLLALIAITNLTHWGPWVIAIIFCIIAGIYGLSCMIDRKFYKGLALVVAMIFGIIGIISLL